MNCCVFGAGAWGTAMALHLDRCGHAVTLVPRRPEHALELASSRRNEDYLPGFELPHRVQIGCEPRPVLMEAELAFLACPSGALRALLEERIRPWLDDAWRLRRLVVMCKGLELETFKTASEIVAEVLPGLSCAVLSGPTYAGEVAAGQPTAVVFAVRDDSEKARADQQALSGPSFRAYRSDDVRGTELGGTLKNVYAIAAGLCDGLRLGDNAKAALLTRGLAELVRLGESLGGRRETFYGLSGFGDLVATCSGKWSRNRTFGERVARGEKPAGIVGGQRAVVEGYHAAECLALLCREKDLDAPILEQVHAICHRDRDPLEALRALMNRDLKEE